MRRKQDAEMPRELMVFEDHKYATEAEWTEAFDAFHDARERWWLQHGFPIETLPPYEGGGLCPWNPDSI